MKPGDKMLIYQKPLTVEDFEGEATLVRRLRAREPGRPLERWLVRFRGGPETFEREIRVEA